MNKRKIEYPCDWTYTVIGTNETLIKEAIRVCLGDKHYRVSFSKKSESGKYVSLNVNTNVQNEAERNNIYSMLCKNPAVKTVL